MLFSFSIKSWSGRYPWWTRISRMLSADSAWANHLSWPNPCPRGLRRRALQSNKDNLKMVGGNRMAIFDHFLFFMTLRTTSVGQILLILWSMLVCNKLTLFFFFGAFFYNLWRRICRCVCVCISPKGENFLRHQSLVPVTTVWQGKVTFFLILPIF